jgi:RNA polymerase sigma-70 factor (ECF subfamily)
MRLEEATFTAFYQRTARLLWAYVYRVTGNAADADDIVAEAFLRLFRSVDIDMTDDALRRYVFKIAGNLLTDRWRRERREEKWRALFETHASPEPEYGAVEAGATEAENITRTFAQLRPRERAILWLAYVEEQSHREIAVSLDLTPGSVKVLLSRARARLRGLLEQCLTLKVGVQ